jgi:Zn-dependent protease with chaperone function
MSPLVMSPLVLSRFIPLPHDWSQPAMTHLTVHLTAHLTTHLAMVVLAVGMAVGLRWLPWPTVGTWTQRWQCALIQFLLPPLLLLTTAIAIVFMGPQGQMVCPWEGWSSYSLAIAFLGGAVAWAVTLTAQAWKSVRQVQAYPQRAVHGYTSHVLDSQTPFVAQVGWWRSHLVISQGLLDTLDTDHLHAVLVHEQAHQTHHDTFWFFSLGWLRRLTGWLPNTAVLWQELLLLRELRADRTAAQQVDGLLLAEALLAVVGSASPFDHSPACAALTSGTLGDRLTERIDALLAPPIPPEPKPRWTWAGLVLGCLPLLVIPFHH